MFTASSEISIFETSPAKLASPELLRGSFEQVVNTLGFEPESLGNVQGEVTEFDQQYQLISRYQETEHSDTLTVMDRTTVEPLPCLGALRKQGELFFILELGSHLKAIVKPGLIGSSGIYHGQPLAFHLEHLLVADDLEENSIDLLRFRLGEPRENLLTFADISSEHDIYGRKVLNSVKVGESWETIFKNLHENGHAAISEYEKAQNIFTKSNKERNANAVTLNTLRFLHQQFPGFSVFNATKYIPIIENQLEHYDYFNKARNELRQSRSLTSADSDDQPRVQRRRAGIEKYIAKNKFDEAFTSALRRQLRAIFMK
ncbi:MAG TPA: hypothetical protein VD999_06800 [Vitreimonas sp.]|nr:hypothetical protein [Vitreimonas sp.]